MTIAMGARREASGLPKTAGAFASGARALWLIPAALIAAMAAATPTSATIVVDTYTGTVFTNAQIAAYYPGNHNDDATGIFGAPSQSGADITGKPFKAVVTTNLALAPNTYTDPISGDVDEVYALATNSALFSTVALTINGVTVSWSENQAGTEVAESGPFQEALLKTNIKGAGFIDTSETFDIQVAASPLNSFDFPSNLAGAGTYSVQPAGENIIDLFDISVVGVTPLVNTGGFLDPTSLTVSVLAAPEPSTWAMMLAGFVGVGGGLRARRRGRYPIATRTAPNSVA